MQTHATQLSDPVYRMRSKINKKYRAMNEKKRSRKFKAIFSKHRLEKNYNQGQDDNVYFDEIFQDYISSYLH